MKHIYGKNNSFAYSPDGSCIVSAAIDEFNIIIIELDDSRIKVKNIIPVDMLSYIITSLAYCPTGKYIAAADSDNKIGIWDVQKNKQIGDTCDEHKDEIVSISFSADSNLIASISKDDTCIVWDFKTKEKSSLYSH